jgi:DNA-binding NarL/FixJ family response regulator
MEAASAPRPVSVVIVHDDPVGRQALQLMVKAPGVQVVASCGSSEECLTSIAQHKPQVALIDLRRARNRKASAQLIRDVARVSPSTACMLLTATDPAGQLRLEALDAGARGYSIAGYLRGEELPGIIKRLAAGERELGDA